MDPLEITTALKERATELGFALSAACPAVSPPGIDRLDQWLDAGYAGQMQYLADRRDAYTHPRHVLDGARSLVVLAMNYRSIEPKPEKPENLGTGQGRVSRYAWGEADYHEVIRDRLHQLADFFRERVPHATVRGVVDTAPLMEREFAQLAGLGWIGKNTLLLNKKLGSWFFLAAILTDIELAYDAPHETDHCGTCRACLDACPTDAFPEPYVLNATRCISYLTIEHRDAIPEELRPGMGAWLFGCDVCQEVCPWNGDVPITTEPAFQPLDEQNPIDLIQLFDLDEAAFRHRFRHTPLWRAKRRGLLRNAAIVLGNQPSPEVLPALVKGLHDHEPLVRAASAWALGRCSSSKELLARSEMETDAEVQGEIQTALEQSSG